MGKYHIPDTRKKIVKIEWLDSGGNNLIWEFKEEWQLTSHKITSIGILVADDKDEVIICQSESEDQYGRLFVIPRGCIKSIKELKG